MKKMLVLLLTLCLLAGMVPLGAGAEEQTVDTSEELVQAITKAQNGDVIKLGGNITIVPKGGDDPHLYAQMTVQNDITLDLDGYKIDFDKETTSSELPYFPLMISVNQGGKLRITGNGTIDADCQDNGAYGIDVNGGEVIVENGTFYGAPTAIQVTKGSLIINGGSFDLCQANKDKKPEQAKYVINCIDKAWGDGTATISVTGGSFCYDYYHNSPETTGSSYIANGYIVIEKDGQYVVEKLDASNAVAMAGEKYFKSLSDAFSGAEDATTIYLLQNTMHNERIDVQKNATLNLGGHTLISEASHSFVVYPDKDFTIQNGTIQNTTGTVAYALKGSTITLDSDATLKCKDGICGTNNKEDEGGATFNVYGKIHSTDIAVWGQGIGNTVNIEGAELTANYFTVYQNGSYGGNTYTIKNSTIYNGKDGGAAIYISNSKKNSENEEQGFQTLTVENSKITGETGIEVKYTNVTIKGEDTEVIATGTPPETTLNNNGSVTTGYAFASTHNGTNSSADGAGGTITIEGGAFSGLIGLQQPTGEAETRASFSITSGYFTSDPSEYCAEGLTGLPGQYVVDGNTYQYMVDKKLDEAVKVATGETVAKPATGVDMGEDDVKKIGETKAVGLTPKAYDTASNLPEEDKANIKKYNEEIKKITGASAAAEGANITTVIAPRLEIEITGYDNDTAEATEKSLTLNIEAVYDIKATTATGDTDMVEYDADISDASKVNTVTIKKNAGTLDTTGQDVVISIPLPTDFVDSTEDEVYVQHKGYEYEAAVTSDEEETPTYTATFTNPHGFSTFVLSTETKTVATVNGTNYTNFQQAVEDAGANGTVTVQKGGQTATGVTHDLKLTNGAGKEITVTINGTEYTIKNGETLTFTYTPPTPPRPTEEKHSITISTDGKGQVTGPASAAEDDKVTLTVKPGADKELYDLKVTDEDGKAIAVTKVNDTTYTFTMPDGKVTIAATFGCDGGDNCPSKAFTDLGDKQWYHDFIDYAVENGLLEGTSPTTMEPNATLIRAQLAQILYNIEDKPAVTGEMVFEDVPASEWFYSPVLWANQNDIINGTSPTTFEPLEDISRQDLALMLYRYAGKPAVTGDLDGFTDADQVGDWAEEAMAWAVAEGIVQGDTPTTLNPTGTATRAEAAAMLQRFLENAA